MILNKSTQISKWVPDLHNPYKGVFLYNSWIILCQTALVVEHQNVYIQMYKDNVKILKQRTIDLLKKNPSWTLHEYNINKFSLASCTMGESINKGMLIIFF